MMKLGIVGSRRRDSVEDHQILRARVRELQPDMIISGGCPKGADNFAEQIAREIGIPIMIYHPQLDNLKSYSRLQVIQAMYDRNKLIARDSDHLLALVSDDRKGGTENTIAWFINEFKKDTLEIL